VDIRTRLSLVLVAVSLVSMALLGTFAYITSADLLQETSLRQLDALAESKKRDLNKVYASWVDKLRLVRSSDQLSRLVRDHIETDDEEALRQLERVLQGVKVALPQIDKIEIYDIDGNEIASAGRTKVVHDPVDIGEDVTHVGTYLTEDGLRVALLGGVSLDGALVGALDIIFDASDIFDITGDYTGLGETGEAFVVMREEGRLTVLNPLRMDVEVVTTQQILDHASDDMRLVFDAGENNLGEAHEDYRGEQVWMATRYLEQPDWGLVVKVDVSEEAKRAKALQESLIDIAVALSAFAIIGGALLGFYLARPIHELAVIVERMRHGEWGLRAEVKGDDEIAYLSEALNEFVQHIETEHIDPSHFEAEWLSLLIS
jgi:hypothetical protein